MYVGPRARKILKPWLEEIGPEEYVFSPARAERLRQETRRDARKTPLYPSHLDRLEARAEVRRKHPKRDHYNPTSLRRAVKRLCNAAKVPGWTPNRLRHNAATRFRTKYGIEIARILLGHRKINTTEIYAEPNARKARQAALDLG